MDVGTLTARLTLDTSQFDRGISDAQSTTRRASRHIGRGFSQLGTAAAAGLAAAGAGAGGLGARLISLGDELDKTSSKLGVSVEFLQDLNYWAGQNGISTSTMERAVGRLNQRLGDGSAEGNNYVEAIQNIGVATQDTNGQVRETEEVLRDTIDALMSMESSSERSAAASDIFGTSVARELMPALEDGTLTLEEATDAMDGFGRMTSEQAEAAADLQDAWGDVREAIRGAMTRAIAPLMEMAADRLVPFVEDRFIPAVQDLAENFSDRLADGISDVQDAYEGSWLSEIPAIASDIRDTINPAVERLAEFLGDNLTGALRGLGAVTALAVVTKGIAGVAAALLAIAKSPIALVITGAMLLGIAFQQLYERTEFFPRMAEVIGDAFSAISGLFADNPMERAMAALRFPNLSGLVSQFQDTFGSVVSFLTTVGEDIAAVFTTLWPYVQGFFESMSVAFMAFGGTLAILVNAVMGVVENLLQIFGGFFTMLEGIWNTFIGLLTGDWDRFFEGLKQIVIGAWEIIKGIFGAAWNTLVGIVAAGVTLVVGIFMTLNNMLIAIGTALGEWIISWWSNTWDWVTERFAAWREGITSAFSLFRTIATGIFTAVTSAIRSVWDSTFGWISGFTSDVLGTVANYLRRSMSRMRSSVQTGVNAMRSAWERLRRAFARPVNFVINSVYNNGIRRLWNRVADVVPGVSGLASMNPIALNTGGYVPGGGPDRDSVLTHLTPGEFVLNRRAARNIPDSVLAALNDPNRPLSRLRVGTTGGDPSDLLQGLNDGGYVRSPDEVLSWARRNQGPYQWGGFGPNFDCSGFMAALSNVAAAGNPRAGGRWATGMAGGRSLGRFVRGSGDPSTGFSIGVARGNPGHTAGTIAGTNVESSGGRGSHVGGARGWSYGNMRYHLPDYGVAQGLLSTFREVWDQVHSLRNEFGGVGELFLESARASVTHAVRNLVEAIPGGSVISRAIFDNGGVLAPGWNTVYNATGGPEPLVRPETLMQHAGIQEPTVVNIYVEGSVVAERDLQDSIIKTIRTHERRNGSLVR